jgi:ketosteroid isomerase-like protein
MTIRICGIVFIILATVSAPGLAQTESDKSQQPPTALAKTLEAIVAQQAADWNKGDIESFMKGYWNDENLTFSSGGVTERGWKATRQRYLKGYPDRETMGKLAFSELEVFPLGDEAALMLGRWKLERKEPIGGNFSLVWRKIAGSWLIVHDHTSADRPATQKKE